MSNDKSEQLVQECKRQSEACLYTSTSLFIWLRTLRTIKVLFIVVPLVLGSLASGRLLIADGAKVFVAICAFVAGLLPSIYSVLKFEDKLKECASLAAEFKNLHDRFRQAALVAAQKPFKEFEVQFDHLMTRLEQARKPSFTAPEWCFNRARKKIKKGDYEFDVDIDKSSSQ
jgi:hypothetical protein